MMSSVQQFIGQMVNKLFSQLPEYLLSELIDYLLVWTVSFLSLNLCSPSCLKDRNHVFAFFPLAFIGYNALSFR